MKKMQWTDPVTEAVLINSESVLGDVITDSTVNGKDNIEFGNDRFNDNFDIASDDWEE